MTSNLTVYPGAKVFVHMTLTLNDGSVADSSRVNGKPAMIELGNDSVSTAMENELLGLTVGAKKTFKLAAVDAFGDSNPNLVQFMDMHHFPHDIELKEGAVVAFEQPSGEPMPGIIREVQGHSVKVDFNHPLAGYAVTFEVEVLSIDEPPVSH
ncbi:MAG: FKBP-type peptidyl-prolyl cis-trans isomerase [Gammaproteobacteria bacterium]|nr:FKBP-type peptidyl-prolyl cis-trans isomerase [Gammaproteobacteria bacterium]NVK89157.1 FKBP-type peptidyl-prolyl cis-trans isomerase [Gammaproteobacteria bacterium]